MTCSAPLQPRPSPAAAAKASRGAISLLKAADARVLSLESELRQRDCELEAAREALALAQEAAARREAEAARLAAVISERGPDLDALTWRHRSEANEALILQLNEQVEALTRELAEVQRRAIDRAELEAAHASAAEAESRAAGLAAEREAVVAEVEAMQAALGELQRAAAADAGARARLGRLKAALEDTRTQVGRGCGGGLPVTCGRLVQPLETGGRRRREGPAPLARACMPCTPCRRPRWRGSSAMRRPKWWICASGWRVER